MNVTIDLAALRDWETGAPDPNPNVDPAFDPDEPDGSDPNVDPDFDRGFDAYEAITPASVDAAPHFADTLPTLPAPWRMSIEALDSWVAFYRTRLRGLGRGCGALTAIEETHRAEVEGQVNSRHEARRHSSFPR